MRRGTSRSCSTTPALGRLTLDRSREWFEGTARLGGRRCHIAVPPRDVARAGRVVATLERNLDRIRAAVVRRLLPVYNRSWRADGPVLTREVFWSRLKPASVVVDGRGSGSATVYFADGGLFLGHAIEVRLGTRGGVRVICLAG